MNAESLSTTFQAPDGVVTQSIGNELVVLNNTTETYFSLDAPGAVMYEALANGSAVDAVVALVCASFEGTDEIEVRKDTVELLATLRDKQLLEPRNAA